MDRGVWTGANDKLCLCMWRSNVHKKNIRNCKTFLWWGCRETAYLLAGSRTVCSWLWAAQGNQAVLIPKARFLGCIPPRPQYLCSFSFVSKFPLKEGFNSLQWFPLAYSSVADAISTAMTNSSAMTKFSAGKCSLALPAPPALSGTQTHCPIGCTQIYKYIKPGLRFFL